MIKFREMRSMTALREIFRHKNSWNFLLSFIQSYDEIEESEIGEIEFVYYDGKSLDKNLFSNDKDFFWIAGFDENRRLCFLQLMHKCSKPHLELVVAQKRKTSAEENLFGNLIEFIRNTYDAKYLSTLPINDRLKEYYKANGFYDWKNELRLDLK